MISREGVPSSISKLPGFVTLPATDTSFVPVEPCPPSSAYFSPPISTMAGTVASVSTLLMSVGPWYRPWLAGNGGLRGRLAALAPDRGEERRLGARVAALALERVEQRRLLAADVGAGAAVDPELERVVGAEDAVAEVALGPRLLDGLLEARGLQVVLAADVDERARRADDVRRDDHALDEHVRRLLHELAVLERAGLGLVGVADEVLVHRPLGQEGPLLAHRESGAAAAADPRAVELGQDVLAAHAERLAQRAVAAAALVDVEGVEARLVDVLEEQEVGHERLAFGSTLLRSLSCFSGSTSSPARICCTAAGTSSISIGPT